MRPWSRKHWHDQFDHDHGSDHGFGAAIQGVRGIQTWGPCPFDTSHPHLDSTMEVQVNLLDECRTIIWSPSLGSCLRMNHSRKHEKFRGCNSVVVSSATVKSPLLVQWIVMACLPFTINCTVYFILAEVNESSSMQNTTLKLLTLKKKYIHKTILHKRETKAWKRNELFFLIINRVPGTLIIYHYQTIIFEC